MAELEIICTGKKRYVIVDTLGPMLVVAITPADVRDRDGMLTAFSGL
jgi:hypothetical protein